MNDIVAIVALMSGEWTHPACASSMTRATSAGLRPGNSELLGWLKHSRRHAADDGMSRMRRPLRDPQ